MGGFMSRFERTVLSFLCGMMVMAGIMAATMHIRDASRIKMYTEGKIVCTTLADEFICREAENDSK